MAYWLDYSAAKLSGSTIKSAGYSGVIRYIDSPLNLGNKHTNLAEYQSHKAAGLAVQLVMQTTTSASDGGFPVGQDHARRALAGANYLGYNGPIYFTNDRPTVPNPAAWRAYLDGAASILGLGRTGAYGFANAMDLAVGHASFFWQSGRRSDVRAHTHLWQDNNVQVTVGGITCDRNLILKPLEDEVSVEDVERMLFRGGPVTGAVAEDTVVARVRDLENMVWAGGPVLGAVADDSLIGRVRAQDSKFAGLATGQEQLLSKVNALSLAGVDVAALAAALKPLLPTAEQVADEMDRRNRDGDPSTGQVS